MDIEKKCSICGKPLKKTGRTVHYTCRCVEKFKKNGGNTCETRRKAAFKAMQAEPSIFIKMFK